MSNKTKGGKREPLKLKTSQSRMLAILWNLYGGATRVSEILGLKKQLPVNWKLRGKVPLKYVGYVSRKLKVAPELLNFEEVVNFNGRGKPWSIFVKRLELPRQEERYVFKGMKPRVISDILQNG